MTKTRRMVCAVMVAFTFAYCLPTLAQDDNLTASIDNIDDLPGQTETYVKKSAISDNTFPETDRSKIFFIYNVKTGLLLNAGGYWGTHVSLKEFGMPLWVHLDKSNYIHFAQKFDKSDTSSGEGNYLEYNSSDNTFDNGVYVDRSYGSSDNITKRGWAMEAVSGKTGVYRLYTYLYGNSKFGTTKYYLIAFDQQGDVDKNCDAVAEGSSDIKTASSSSETGNDEWKLITYQQIFDLQKKNTENITKSLDLTFRLQCPGFSRENAALSNWKTSKYGGDGQIRFGLEHYYKTTDGNGNVNSSYVNDFSTSSKNHISSYKFPDGTDQRTFTSSDDYERHCGKYYAADIKNAHGAIYQDIDVVNGGAYVVECKGFSNTTKAKLFAVVIKKTTQSDGTTKVENVKNTLHMTVFGQTTYMSDKEKTALHIDEQNMDYAAKEFYGNHKYISSVLVQVPENGGTIRFGIEVGSHDDTAPTASDKEWTVFDDFRLLYASKTTDGDLVLDADRDELGYLKDCSNIYKNVTLHLNKSFTKDKWNGFILPVDLTRDQLTQAFGPNVRLAKLSKVTDTEIQFTSIDVTAQANDAVVMQAYIPYIIFPTKHLELEQTPPYTALLSETGSGEEAKDVHIAIKKNHIDIPNVSFAIGSNNLNDLSHMNKENWTTNSNTIVDATTGSPIVGSNNKMTAYGTFARTFAPTTSGTTDKDNYQAVSNDEADDYGEWHLNVNKGTFIDGRDDLSGSYFYDNGKMWHAKNNQKRGLRGFSVWFKPTTTTTSTNEAKLMLDGISMDDKTTDISQLIYGDEGFGENHPKVEKFANGIYTLQGQLVRSDNHSLNNLPSGIYIVNGKKVVVK